MGGAVGDCGECGGGTAVTVTTSLRLMTAGVAPVISFQFQGHTRILNDQSMLVLTCIWVWFFWLHVSVQGNGMQVYVNLNYCDRWAAVFVCRLWTVNIVLQGTRPELPTLTTLYRCFRIWIVNTRLFLPPTTTRITNDVVAKYIYLCSLCYSP